MFDFLKSKHFFPKFIKEKYSFPCKNCLVLPCCSKSGECEELEWNGSKVRELFLEHECCIDCGSTMLYKGASGAGCTNVTCVGCGHRFNMGLPVFIERLMLRHRTK